jgi:hypothetical protein
VEHQRRPGADFLVLLVASSSASLTAVLLVLLVVGTGAGSGVDSGAGSGISCGVGCGAGSGAGSGVQVGSGVLGQGTVTGPPSCSPKHVSEASLWKTLRAGTASNFRRGFIESSFPQSCNTRS